MNTNQHRCYADEPHAQHDGNEKRWTLIVSSEPAMLSMAQLSLHESLVESKRLFTATELLHQPP
jgi:hypothetical protein